MCEALSSTSHTPPHLEEEPSKSNTLASLTALINPLWVIISLNELPQNPRDEVGERDWLELVSTK
jgi:hypothetical protein